MIGVYASNYLVPDKPNGPCSDSSLYREGCSRTADAFIRRLTKAVRRLKRFPMSGNVIAELGSTELREIYCGSYRIIYRVVARNVEIVTVRHAARLLGPDVLH